MPWVSQEGIALWPLSVDGLLLLATVGLLEPAGPDERRKRYVVWALVRANRSLGVIFWQRRTVSFGVRRHERE
jgi:hypothetical protein